LGPHDKTNDKPRSLGRGCPTGWWRCVYKNQPHWVIQ